MPATDQTASIAPPTEPDLEAAELVERDAWFDLFEAAPLDVKRAFALSHGEVGSLRVLASRQIPITEFNRAMAVGVGRRHTDEELDAAVRWLDHHAAPNWALQVAPFAQASLPSGFMSRNRLAASGSGWTKFVRSGSPRSAPMREGTAKVTIVDPDAADTFGTTVQGGFGLPSESARWFAALVGRPGWVCFLASQDDEPAGAAALYLSGATAWSGVCATIDRHRGRGVQARLVEARIEAAMAAGASVLTSETGSPSTPDEVGSSSYRNQVRGGFAPAYVRPNLKRA